MASADRTSPSNGPPATNISSDRFQFHHVRSELERAVRFVNDHETTRTMACHHHLHSWEPHHSLRVHTTTDDMNDYEDFDGIGMDDASGLAIPAHKAASYSNAPRSSRMVPCSPPVPIPQKHRQRRNSVASMRSASSSSLFIPIQDNQYSRTQCEAQLRDEYWNYKLSLESRESFEASTTNQQDDGVRGSSINQSETPKPRADSEASTEDTTREYSGDEGTTDADPHVFDMDEF